MIASAVHKIFALSFLLLLASRSANAQFLEALLDIPVRIECTLGYSSLGFNLTDYDAYPTYFREDSIMSLAQAGNYEGVEGIQEYVTFTQTDSPYLLDSVVVDADTRIGGYDADTGQCIFDLALRRRFVPDPATTNPEFGSFDGFSMAKLYYDLEQGYISRINLYFPIGFITHTFVDLLDSNNTRQYMCDLLAGPCSDIILDHDNAACTADLAALPVFTDGGYVDGNGSGCRSLHAALSAINPEIHCAHLSLSVTDLDPNDKNKCSVSAQVPVDSLIGESDLAFYRQFAESHGVDPDSGVISPSPPIVEADGLDSVFSSIWDSIGSLADLLFGGFFTN